ncbi:hypothetical protein H6A68_02890 [Bifidobacterium pullorum subsp. saeculare]|uniref:hypothetical protein n=1 Tax=Bifidobacterium pullorum TaxID=78448 RepID=UPI00195CB305|nr:hypothetical protein [Bifidobacterium pullorum]MBM6706010.1 hypothetical protein [Bifidobacterium pullorum subsp. saeculare]
MLKHADLLEADFQRVYGLDLNDAGRSYSWLHAANLAANLPDGSMSWTYINRMRTRTLDQYLSAAAVNAVRMLKWRMDGYQSKAKPELINLNAKPKPQKPTVVAFDTPEQLMRQLGRARMALPAAKE